jgi:hypothetical protein
MEAAHTDSSRRSLGEIFVQRGLISEDDLEQALAEQLETKRRLADILVRQGLVTGSDITSALNEQLAAFNVAEAHPGSDAPLASTASDSPDADEPNGAAPVTPLLYSVEEPGGKPVFDTALTGETPAEEELHDDVESFDEPEPAAQSSDLDEPTTTPEADVDVSFEPAELIHETEVRRQTMESRLAALGPILEGVERVKADLVAHELCSPLLAQELAATQQRLVAREDELSAEIVMLKETREDIERTAVLHEEIRAELAEKLNELTELRTTAAMWTARVTAIEADVESLTALANEAARDLNALAATCVVMPPTDSEARTHGSTENDEAVQTQWWAEQEPAQTEPTADAESHILFVPVEDGYELVEQIGPAPGIDEVVEVGDESWVVMKLGRSPLPFDGRDCAFLTTSP